MAARLLFLVNDAGFFLSHRLALALEAHHRGFAVHVATRDDAAAERIRSYPFEYHRVPIKRGLTGIRDELAALAAVRRIYQRVDPDIVHHIALKAMLLGGLAARAVPRAAVVSTLTGRGYMFTSNSVRSQVVRSVAVTLLRRALDVPRGRVIFQNEDDLELFVSLRLLDRNRAVLIRGSGVDLSEFRPSPEPAEGVRVLYAGRLLRDKGLEELAAAARIIQPEYPHVRFRVLGRVDPDNPSAVPKEWMEEQVRDGVFDWAGYSSDMAAELRMSHIVCLPSTTAEGTPKTLLEAAAAGRPIITTDVPGCRGVVNHGETGLLVAPGDVAALVAAIQQLAAAPALRQQMGAAGRELARSEFALQLVLDRTIEVYDELLGRDRGASGPGHLTALAGPNGR